MAHHLEDQNPEDPQNLEDHHLVEDHLTRVVHHHEAFQMVLLLAEAPQNPEAHHRVGGHQIPLVDHLPEVHPVEDPILEVQWTHEDLPCAMMTGLPEGQDHHHQQADLMGHHLIKDQDLMVFHVDHHHQEEIQDGVHPVEGEALVEDEVDLLQVAIEQTEIAITGNKSFSDAKINT